MKIQVKASQALNLKTNCRLVFVKQLKNVSTQQSELNKATDKLLDRLQDADQLSGSFGQIVAVFLHGLRNRRTQ